VRELIHVIQRAAVLSGGEVIDADNLPELLRDAPPSAPTETLTLKEAVARLERQMIVRALEGLTVTVANDNSPDQVVLSGLGDDVRVAERRLAEGVAGAAPRLVPLDVSAPFHSPLMAPIEPAFAAVLEAASARWDAAGAPCVTSNLTGAFHDADLAALRTRLVRQISATVRWRSNMHALTDRPTRVIEVGPGRPLRGFFKTIGVPVESITDVRSAARVLDAEGRAA